MMVEFSEVFTDSTKFARKIKKGDYLDSGTYPIIDQGQEFVIGYTNDGKGLYKDVPAIIFGDHTRIIKYIDRPFFIGADGVKVLKTKIDNADYKYLFYALRNIDIINTGYNRHFKWLKESKIKLPELKKQQKIATILDSIENIVNLKNKQLQEYDQLIKSRFVEMFGDIRTNTKGLKSKLGSKLFKFSSGKFLIEEKRRDRGIPVYGGNGIAWYTEECLINHPTIIIGRVGAYCGNIQIVKEPVWITDNAIYIKKFYDNSFNIDFLYKMMSIMDFSKFADYSGQPKITQKPLENSAYLIPDRVEQDAFSTFVSQIDKLKFEDEFLH